MTIETGVRQLKQLIGGEWDGAADGATFDVLDPFEGEVIAQAPASGRTDARQAIEAAWEAFEGWAATPPAVRQKVFLAAADLLEERSDEVVAALAQETGCTLGFAMFQMGFVPGLFRQAAGLAYTPVGEIIPSDTPGTFAMGVRRPVGVVGAISPWNAALILSARSITAPLVAGNTVVAKPSEESPFTGGLLWGEIFEAAGLPPGVLNVITHAPGGAAEVAAELVEHPHVRRLNFTGSTATGRLLAEAAGRNLKRIVLELGGSNPLIVLGDADLEYAVGAAAFGAYLHQGQICMSARRIIVEASIADDFIPQLAERAAGLKTGSPAEPDTIIGPLINRHALELVSRRVDEAVAGGARILAGGRADGACYQATLVTDVPPESELARLETFGPVAMVSVVPDADAAVAAANDTVFGLSAGVITGNADRGLAIAERLRSGIVHINDQPIGDEPQMPFGGVRDSGWGRFGGTAALDEFTELRWFTVQSGTHPWPF